MNMASICNMSNDELIRYAIDTPMKHDECILLAEVIERFENAVNEIDRIQTHYEEALDEAQEDIDRVTSDFDEALQDIHELQDEVEELKKELESARTVLNDYVEAEYGGDS